jgi:hypothetical protein
MFQALRRFLGLCGPTIPACPRPRVKPRVEELEDRWVPSASLILPGHAGLITPPQLPTALVASAVPQTTTNPSPATTSTPAAGAQTVTPPIAATPVAAPAPTTPAPQPNIPSQTQEVDATFAASPIDFSQTGGVAQFNPALGTLTGVQIVQEGTLTSHVVTENRDTQPQNISATVQGTITLQAGGVTLQSNPTVQASDQVKAFDNTTDLSGPDTNDFGAQSNTDTQTTTLTAPTNDLSAFIGTGTVSLTETGTATGSVQGPGSMAAWLDTQGSANVKVIYTYTPAPGNLSGFVYLDNNQNGVRDGSDSPIPGVTITLQGNGVNQSVQTDSTGAYAFTNLAPGTYTITKTPPAGYVEGTNDVGSLGGAVNGDTFTVTLPPAGNGTDYDFGELIPPPPPPPPPNVVPTPPPSTTPPGNPPTSQNPPPSSTPVTAFSKRLFVGGGWKSLV